MGLLDSRRIWSQARSKLLKTWMHGNGTAIATSGVPVMYRLLEDSGEPTKKQALGKSIRH